MLNWREHCIIEGFGNDYNNDDDADDNNGDEVKLS